MKTHVIFLLTGALLGAAVASVVVPPALSWYASPGGMPQGVQVQVVAQMPAIIHYATSKLILSQAIGAGIGAVACLGISIFIAMKRRSRTATA